MIEMLLSENKETDNKVRWATDIEGVSFKLYIPKWRVPDPWPKRINVSIGKHGARKATKLLKEIAEGHPESREQPIVANLQKFRKQTQTIRYRPDGDESEWEMGEPYIPAAMTMGESDRLTLEVRWK